MLNIFEFSENNLHTQCFKTLKKLLRHALEYMKLHSIFLCLYSLEVWQGKSERKKNSEI